MLRGGIDLGGTKIGAVVVDDGDSALGQARQPTPARGGPADVVAAIAAAISAAADTASCTVDELEGVGVGSPGAVDTSAGTVASARNLPNWDAAFPLAAALEREIGVPVKVGNDVDVAVEAEAALGAGRPFRTLLGLWWGTGVGGAIMIDGKRWLGRGAAGEIGHTVVKLDGAPCPCGRRGCLEAYAGRGAMEQRARRAVKHGAKTSLFKLMEKHGRTRLTSSIWQRALEQHDELAERLIERAIRALGAGAASAINLTDLEAVVVGGGLGTRLGEDASRRIRGAMEPHLFVSDRPPEVCLAELGDLGGAIGAARLLTT